MPRASMLRAMQRDLRWLVAGLGLSASAVALVGCDSPEQHGSASNHSATAVPIGSDGERIHPPEGQWCAKPDIAKGLVILGSPEVDGCPKFLDGARIPKEKELSPEYVDMPRSTYGFYDDIRTKMRRGAINHAPLCCYHWKEKTPGGRPLVASEGVAIVAPLVEPADAPLERRDLLRPPDELAEAVFEYWRRQAQLEHASVASFARARVELLALGAPRELVSRYSEAARDELRHTELALGVLAAWGEPKLHCGPLAIPRGPEHRGSRREILSVLARRTLDEAFEPEAAAALALFNAAQLATCPNLARVLASIAWDERRHALLALDTIRWCRTEAKQENLGAPPAAATAKNRSHPLSSWGVIADDAWRIARLRCRALSVALLA